MNLLFSNISQELHWTALNEMWYDDDLLIGVNSFIEDDEDDR